MAIPASKVRAVCTPPEVALVRASRKGEIELHSQVELKRLAVRARRLSDKWQDLGRSQSRVKSRAVGFGDTAANTQLKGQIFRDALDNFEARLAKLEGKPKVAANKVKPKTKPKTKAVRAAQHRAERAGIRKGMTAAEDLLNTKGRKTKKPAKSASAPAPTPAAQEPAPPVAKGRPRIKTASPSKRPAASVGIDASRQLRAATSAKTSRFARSGKTTRLQAHVSTRGRRNQARRDGKG